MGPDAGTTRQGKVCTLVRSLHVGLARTRPGAIYLRVRQGVRVEGLWAEGERRVNVVLTVRCTTGWVTRGMSGMHPPAPPRASTFA